jgi:amino acid transporter
MTNATTQTSRRSSGSNAGLRSNALGFPALLAQSIALISPTMTAVLIIPLAFSNAGQGTWLAYLFGTVMLLFVVFSLNQFARRSASAGSMYTYTSRGLGATTGVFSGWTLIWSYLFIGMAGLTGFAVFAAQFLGAIGLHAPPPVVFFAISTSPLSFPPNSTKTTPTRRPPPHQGTAPTDSPPPATAPAHPGY